MWRRLLHLSTGVVVPVALLVIWEAMTRAGIFPPSMSASPSRALYALASQIYSGPLAKYAAFSLLRIVAGVVIGGVFGVVAGWSLSEVRGLRMLLSPMLLLMAPIPVVAWMPFVILVAGTGEAYRIGLVAIAAFFILFIHAYEGFSSVDRRHIELAMILRKSHAERLWHVLLPSALPNILTGLRLSLAISWIVVFFVEYGSAREGQGGLGWFIYDARQVGRVEDEYAGVILLAALGFVTDKAVLRLQRSRLKWMDRQDEEGGK